MGMWEQPIGFPDLLADAERAGISGKFETLDVPNVGPILARRPVPASIASLAMSVKTRDPVRGESEDDAKLAEALEQQRYLGRFLADHLAEGERERIVTEMMDGELSSAASLDRIMGAVATWGTARPYTAVASFALWAGMHWRDLRGRLLSYGVADPMLLPSMHAVLDEAEKWWLESLHTGDEQKDKATIDGLIDKLYAPELEDEPEVVEEGTTGGRRRRRRGKPPPWFNSATAESTFDNLGRSLGAP